MDKQQVWLYSISAEMYLGPSSFVLLVIAPLYVVPLTLWQTGQKVEKAKGQLSV